MLLNYFLGVCGSGQGLPTSEVFAGLVPDPLLTPQERTQRKEKDVLGRGSWRADPMRSGWGWLYLLLWDQPGPEPLQGPSGCGCDLEASPPSL